MFGFKSKKTKLKELVNSNRFKNSGFEVHIVNDSYGLKDGDKYVDLENPNYSWLYGNQYTEDCFGDIDDVIYAFNYIFPIIKPLKIDSILK